jgi:glycine dehydrogenase
MITDLTGMDISNASLLDEATACAEAVSVAYSSHNCKRSKFYVSDSIFPQNLDVIQTRCYGNGVEVVVGPIAEFPWH